MRKFFPILVGIVVCELVGLVGTFLTIEAIPKWYATLNKPFFSPPNWIFGPVWTILFAAMGIAAGLVWNSNKKFKEKYRAEVFFGVQLAFNFMWSILFFGLRSPILGMMDLVGLWILIALTIVNFKKINPLSAWLLVPYLFWVSFASVLNLAIVLLNPV